MVRRFSGVRRSNSGGQAHALRPALGERPVLTSEPPSPQIIALPRACVKSASWPRRERELSCPAFDVAAQVAVQSAVCHRVANLGTRYMARKEEPLP